MPKPCPTPDARHAHTSVPEYMHEEERFPNSIEQTVGPDCRERAEESCSIHGYLEDSPRGGSESTAGPRSSQRASGGRTATAEQSPQGFAAKITLTLGCQGFSGAAMAGATLFSATVDPSVPDAPTAWAAIGGATLFTLNAVWKMVRAWWKRYGPDVVIIQRRHRR